MPSAPVFNLDALLAPIAGENPSGENLQYSGLHDEIREARRADDDVPQGDWVRELKVADWEKVAELAGENLSRQDEGPPDRGLALRSRGEHARVPWPAGTR